MTSPARDRVRREASPSRTTSTSNGGWSAAVSASSHNNTSEYDSTFNNSDDLGYERERKRTQSVGNRLHKKPPLPVVVKVKAKEFHSSADLLRAGPAGKEGTDGVRQPPPHYVCGDFESNGMYSATGNTHHRYNGDYGGSNPSLTHSYSSPGIAIAAGRLQRHSPNTAKRLEQLALTSSSHGSSRDHLDYTPPPLPSYAEHTMGTGSESEHSQDMWDDVHSEETLV